MSETIFIYKIMKINMIMLKGKAGGKLAVWENILLHGKLERISEFYISP